MSAQCTSSAPTESIRTSHFPIQRFPNEILSRIFEIGTWLGDDPDNNFTRYRGEWTKPHRRPHPPHRKFLAKTIALVCSRWNQIACWRGNYLTFTTVRLTLDDSLLEQLPAFRWHLRQSSGSDLDVVLECNSTVDLSKEDNSCPSREAEALRLFMHGISMLRPYINNVRSIYAELLHADAAWVLMGILNDLRPNSRLTQFRLKWTKTTEYSSVIVEKDPSIHFLRDAGNAPGSGPRYRSCFNSFTSTGMYGISSRFVSQVPSRLEQGSVWGFEASSPLVNCKRFSCLMQPLFALRSLHLDLCHFTPNITSTRCDEISLPNLRELLLIGVCFDLLEAFIKSFRVPNLLTLKLLRAFVRRSSTSDPSEDKRSSSHILATHPRKSQLDSLELECVERPLRVERLLHVGGELGVDQIICLLSLLDVRSVEEMIIRHYIYDMSLAEKPPSRNEIDHRIVLPRLRHLEFYTGIADETSHFLAHLCATKLSFFEDHFYMPELGEPMFDTQREKSLSRWRGIIIYEEKWSAVTEMSIDIPAFQPQSQRNVFSAFPRLEHLAFFLDNGVDGEDMDWSGLNWLCSTFGNDGAAQKDEIPLQNLKNLDLQIFAGNKSPRIREELLSGTREWTERIRRWRETQRLSPMEQVRLLEHDFESPEPSIVELECIKYSRN